VIDHVAWAGDVEFSHLPFRFQSMGFFLSRLMHTLGVF
jgi:hypothetical protein